MNGRLPLLLTFLLVAPVAAQDYSATMILCRWDITSSVIAGDLNGDAAPDLIFGNGRHYPERSLIYFNDGSGWLLGEHPLFAVTRKTYRIGLGDFDQDGDLDAVEVTDFGDFNQIFWNNGSGIFSAGPTLGGQQFQGGRLLASRDVDVADLDGDGWVDIVVATRESGPSLVLLNRKAGTEWEVLSLGEPGPSIRVATADLDSDGDIDIVLGRRGPNQIWWNDGNKTFRSVTLEGTAGETVGLVVTDLDGSGGPDLVFGNEGAPNEILWNDGSGVFDERTTFGHPDGSTRAVAAGDLDGDGDIDLVVGNLQTGFEMLPEGGWVTPLLDVRNRVYWNVGKRMFSPGPTFGGSGVETRDIAIADMNRDGKLDIIEARDCGANAVHLGR